MGEADLAIIFEFYETHYSTRFEGPEEKRSRRFGAAESAYVESCLLGWRGRWVEAGVHVDSAERSLAGMVASLQLARSAKSLGSHCKSPWLAVYVLQSSCAIDP